MYIGSPDNSAHSKYDPYSEVSTKVNNAIKYGASGVIFTRINNTEKDPSGQLSVTIRPTAIPVLFVHDTTVISAIHAKIFSKVATLENTAHNVIGFKNNKKKTTIIIGAHQDHLGYNELGGSRTKEEGKIHNGADDNASGVAVMMELMRKLSKGKYKKHNYLFIAFSGEEEGLLGSNYYVKHPLIPNDKIACMLNFDMLGRLDSTKKKLMVYGVGTSPVWKPAIETISTDSFNIKIRTTESGTGSSDHTSFYYQNIPDLHFFTGQHKDYHLPSDDEALINYTGMWYSYDYIYKLIGKINKVKTIPFTPTKNNESEFVSYKVTLGIMPDYIYDGSGLRVDGVNKDRPGDKAGLKTGDIIIKLGDFPVSSVQEYMKALSEYNKGDKTTITITRGTQTMILPATFE
ncbi:MAG: M20/M25/M40 family metallo-hydrolase [Bacteroidia bacterium]|nr:M20/M25/M40 family metallo-hydrolase [Bacteroidia bacterium]